MYVLPFCFAIGCAGDANPHPRPGFDLALKHGHTVLEGPPSRHTMAVDFYARACRGEKAAG